MKSRRAGGVLLHISSLPGGDGIGVLGEEAKKFVDKLALAGQKFWQILPLGHTGYGNSPYSALSAFAGNPLLIDLRFFDSEIYNNKAFLELSSKGKVDYKSLIDLKIPLLISYANDFLNQRADENVQYKKFKEQNSFWLDDYAIFVALKNHFGGKPFYEFPEKLRRHEAEEVALYADKLKHEIEVAKALQYFFFAQWNDLKNYANSKGVKIIGDIPLYVAEDSVDLWANPEVFMLDDDLKPCKVAGVPPDYFSKTGQLWGNPVYDWEYLQSSNYAWWIERIRFNLTMFDVLRIDHFIGLSQFWAVPYGDATAEHGEWLPAKGDCLLAEFFAKMPDAEIIAEDLGIMFDEVVKLKNKYNLPGMKILQFAFNSKNDNPFLPHNFEQNCISYTGTHDNNTLAGWLNNADEHEKNYCLQYANTSIQDACKNLIRLNFASVADTVITPMQDVLELGEEHRMNIPGVCSGNWEWRMSQDDFTDSDIAFLRQLCELYGR